MYIGQDISTYPGLYTQQFISIGDYETVKEPFAALPLEWYEKGLVKPGDYILVHYIDFGVFEIYRAYDAGLFGPNSGYYVVDWPDLPIIVDIPDKYAFFGLSTRVKVTNLSHFLIE